MYVKNTFTEIEQTKIKSILKKFTKNNKGVLEDYQGGKKGLIGVFLNEILENTTHTFNTKKSKQELILFLKKELNN